MMTSSYMVDVRVRDIVAPTEPPSLRTGVGHGHFRNPGVATVNVSENTVLVTAVKDGSAIITIEVAEGTNHTAPARPRKRRWLLAWHPSARRHSALSRPRMATSGYT